MRQRPERPTAAGAGRPAVTPPVPLRPDALASRLADAFVAATPAHPLRVLVDGPPWSQLELADLLRDALTERGRHVVVVNAHDFLRPSSLRFERGREDPDPFYESWIDVDALRREVIDAAGPEGSQRVLPTLWDATRDRATRADYVALTESSVVVVNGWFLLGQWLDFDRTIHIALSTAARARRVPPVDAARELPAWKRYDAEVRPSEVADVVVLADDPRRPAVVIRGDQLRNG